MRPSLRRALCALLVLLVALPATTTGTGTNTGSAGATVNNVAPAIDVFVVYPSMLTLDDDDVVQMGGNGHDDNGREDIATVTMKLTSPSGVSTFPQVRTGNGTDPLDLLFLAWQRMNASSEIGTYQVDGFLTDGDGVQSDTVSTTFTVLPPQPHEDVEVAYTDDFGRVSFGTFSPGATNVESQNAFTVKNNLGYDAHFLFDMADFACSRGTVPVMGNADVILAGMDEAGTFHHIATKPYTESTVDFGILDDRTSFIVKLTLRNIPKGIAGLCATSFGLYSF
jgi:hypothetical protein